MRATCKVEKFVLFLKCENLKLIVSKSRTTHSPTVRLSKNPLTFKQQKVDNIWLKMYLIG
jgi:hypothetical protein